MDVYRALKVDVPQVLFTVLHQAAPAVTSDEYMRAVMALQSSIREQDEEIGEALRRWLEQHYSEQAEEMARKLQMLGLLSADADLERVQQALLRDYTRLGNRIGAASMLGMQGAGEEVFSTEMPADPDLATRIADGREYLTSLGFRPGQGAIHKSWLLCRGSIHYDIIEHIVRERLGIVGIGDQMRLVGYTAFSAYNLVYELGEGLTADRQAAVETVVTQEVTIAFSKGTMHDSPFRQEVSALMEHLAEQIDLLHASFWQRKLGLGTGKEFVLRLRLPVGEAAVKEAISVISHAGGAGREAIVEGGKLLLGTRVI